MTTKLALNIIRTPAEVQSWGFVGEVLITYTFEGELPDARLAKLYEEMKTAKPICVLAASVRRVTLTSLQRKKAKEEFADFKKMVVVLNDPMTRGIITAMGWLGLNIKSFGWNNVREACEYVAPPNVGGDAVFQALESIRRQHLSVIGQPDISVA